MHTRNRGIVGLSNALRELSEGSQRALRRPVRGLLEDLRMLSEGSKRPLEALRGLAAAVRGGLKKIRGPEK